MGNFCTRCGKALQEGEVCSCQLSDGKNQQGIAEQDGAIEQSKTLLGGLGQQVPSQSQFGQQASAFIKSFLKEFAGIVKKPVTDGKEMVMKTDMKTPLLLIAFQGIFSAIYVMITEGSVMSELEISTPYFRVFVVTWLLSVGLACVLALLLKLGNFVIKISVSYYQMLSVVAIRSAVLVPAIVMSAIVTEIHMGIGLALFILINIWGFAAIIAVMSSLIEREKLNIFVLMVSIVILLFILLTVFAVSKTVKFYLPNEIRQLISNLDDIEDWLSYML